MVSRCQVVIEHSAAKQVLHQIRRSFTRVRGHGPYKAPQMPERFVGKLRNERAERRHAHMGRPADDCSVAKVQRGRDSVCIGAFRETGGGCHPVNDAAMLGASWVRPRQDAAAASQTIRQFLPVEGQRQQRVQHRRFDCLYGSSVRWIHIDIKSQLREYLTCLECVNKYFHGRRIGSSLPPTTHFLGTEGFEPSCT